MSRSFRNIQLCAILSLLAVAGCTPADSPAAGGQSAASLVQMMELNKDLVPAEVNDAYRTTYEIFVYSFADSDNDGTGDLQGVISKLDYIADMGFNEIWLMPVCPSGTYHKYDVDDYMAIDPAYGTMDDFDELISKCREKNINIIVDLVLNHTSVSHPWFKAAWDYLKELPGDWEPSSDYCPYFDYYNFSRNAQDGYAPLEGTNWYYEARFWSGMPDLNLASEKVRSEIKEIMKFWLDHGVAGFRLDAVTSYYTGNNEMSTDFLKWLVSEGKSLKKDCYFVGEGWTDRSTYAGFYASGIDSMFDFSFANNEGVIASVLKGADAKAYGQAQVNEQELFASYNSDYVNAPFYTNHDMARSAGYYVNDGGRKVKMSGAMNLLMSGNAFVYYGEELGMKGSGKDENKRAPMYWSADPEADGMCSGPADMDEVKMVWPPYEEQKDDDTSILNYYREPIRIRNAFKSISHGTVTMADDISSSSICAYTKEYEGEKVLLVFNTKEGEEDVSLSAYSDFSRLRAVLNTGEEEITYKDGVLHMPAFSIAVLTGE
jgi:glycosidase